MLGRDGPMSPRDVTAATGIHPATLTGILDRLEAGGWLTRRSDPGDRRRVIVTAETGRGGEMSRRYAPMTRAITEVCSDYSVEELARIIDFLERTTNAGTLAISEIRAKTP
jgi:DNA-binding MarR family transcriptional regulator